MADLFLRWLRRSLPAILSRWDRPGTVGVLNRPGLGDLVTLIPGRCYGWFLVHPLRWSKRAIGRWR